MGHKGYILLLHAFNGLLSRTTWISRYHKGKTTLDLNEARDDGVWGCSGIRWTICKYLHIAPDNLTNTSSVNVYRPHALADAQPTVSTVSFCVVNVESGFQNMLQTGHSTSPATSPSDRR